MIEVDDLRTLSYNLAMKQGTGFPSPPEWSRYASLASMDLFNYYMGSTKTYFKATGRPLPTIGPGLSQNVDEALKVFAVNEEVITVTNGSAPIPATQAHNATLTNFDNGKKIKRVPYDRRSSYLDSLIDTPTVEYPIYCEFSDSLLIYPSLSRVKLTYYKTPVDIVWAYTLVGGRPVYDADNSVNFEWQPTERLNLLMRIMEYMGLSVRDTELMQYAEQKEQTVS